MSTEIERKFLLNPKADILVLVTEDDNATLLPSIQMWAHYLTWDKDGVCERIRMEKSDSSSDIKCVHGTKKYVSERTREEYEQEVSCQEALEHVLRAEHTPLYKRRYLIEYEGDTRLKWEFDIFYGVYAGLVIVEIEIPSEDYELILPDWIGEEVTNNVEYTNVQMYFDQGK